MTINGYTSRNIPSPKVFSDVLETRMKAKASGDKETNLALKLVVNTTYGATLNQFNELYDPLQARSVCISGQLYLLELAMHCYKEIPNLSVIQLNTDGLMIEFDDQYYDNVRDITNEWQERTGFELEEDIIVKIAQKDVNNYVEIQDGGKVKAKGGYLVKGIAPAGAFNINNSCCIVATALKEYLAHGTPVEDTINACDDIFQFQIIAKAGGKYKEAFQMVDGQRVSVQKVNRVYATTDTRYGKIYKVKADNNQIAMIDSLPEHCAVDNDNHMAIDEVDRRFYIDMAKKRVDDFKGIQPIKKGRKQQMAEQKPENLYLRLMKVRRKFMEHGISKTGKNSSLKYMYFQLNDIVPVAMPLFEEQNLLPVTNFTKDECTMTIIDMLNSDNMLTFTTPMREYNGNAAVTPVQALGATITYMRRYLYQIVLDIVEVDEMENGMYPTGEQTTAKSEQPAANRVSLSKNAQSVSREEAAKQLTDTSAPASELQVTQLKAALKKLVELDSSKENVVQTIALQTERFTNLTKANCEKLLNKASDMIAEAEKKA